MTFALTTGENLWSASAGVYKWETLQTSDTDAITPPYDRYQLAYRVGSRGNKGQLAGLDWSVETELTEFDRPDLNTLDGTRTVVVANTSHRFETLGGYLQPALRVHSRHYDLDTALTSGDWSGRRRASVTVPTLSLDGGVVFEADRGLSKQTLEPRFLFAQTPYRKQDGLPNYDSGETDFNLSSIYSPYAFSGNDRIGGWPPT